MIVLVAAGEQRQARHLGQIEAHHVSRQIRIADRLQVEVERRVDLLHEIRPDAAAAKRLHGQLVVAHAPDHIEVPVGRDLVHRHRRALDEIGRAQQPDLLARPERQDHATHPILRGQLGARREDGRHTGCVVVGAVVDVARLVGRGQRALIAPAKMVVVGAQHDVGLLH